MMLGGINLKMKMWLLLAATEIIGMMIFSADGNLEGPFCGYAPLCGSSNQTFEVTPDLPPNFPIELDGMVVLSGASVQFEDCCSLEDTQPVRDCEIVHPSGDAYRYITTFNPICESDPNNCEFGACGNYVLVLQPTMVVSNTPGCCDTCSCYGDPECVAFDGTHKMWILCDGREVPEESDHWDRCRITEAVCTAQKDHAGNTCTYLASNKNGKGWNNGKKGSPCVPNPLSPPSIIPMYEFETPDEVFQLDVTQGERGVIYEVFLKMNCGEFTLSADRCLKNGKNAWITDVSPLPAAFHYTDLVQSESVIWDIVDPDTGIAVNIRCYGTVVDGKLYLPRINVEAVSDPLPRTGTSGFCVTGDFDYGGSTTANSEHIQSQQLCIDGLEEFTTTQIYRAICQNPALPVADVDNCIYTFCSHNFVPLYDNIAECVDELTNNRAEGFCRAVVYVESDVEECVEQWFTIGDIPTIEEYLNDHSGCVEFDETKTEPGPCEEGVTLQYLDGGEWISVVFLPDNFCSGDQIVLTKCTHENLFTKPIRFVQNTNDVSCGPSNQCKRITGFQSFIGFGGPPTPSPTEKPTDFPTPSPSNFPSPFPTPSPTSYPTDFPTAFTPPSPFPTGFPSQFPSPFPSPSPTIYPTSFPTGENIPPTPQCTYRLCETEEIYTPIEEDEGVESVHSRMESCCVVPPEVACPGEEIPVESYHRAQGSNQAYCGNKANENAPFKPSCKGKDVLQVKVMFMRNADTECCKSCTCYGDPRCYSFNGTFAEFILCDGRAVPESMSTDERCVIRKDTCLEQKDHEGNFCIWYNPIRHAPEQSDPAEQKLQEERYNVALWGSPCRYDETVSGPSLITLYKVEEFELVAQQHERGYIHNVYLTTHNGRYTLNVTDCLAGKNWVVNEKFGTKEDYFSKTAFGVEDLWTVVDTTTNIEMSIRCTGVFYEGSITIPFLNVEYINEPNLDRANVGKGFCAEAAFDHRSLSTWQHSDYLRDNNFCMNYNLYTTDIILRNAARAIIDYPGLSTLGTEWAFTTFCEKYFAPKFNSVSKCVNAFMSSKTVDEVINAFCLAVTLDTKPCIESIQMMAETTDYIQAFNDARVQYIDTYSEICTVLKSSDLLNAATHAEKCKQTVELQYLQNGVWKTYKVFPTDQAPCNGFMVEFKYKEDKKLFEFPIRVQQQYYPRECTACSYVNTVDTWFNFVPFEG